MIVNFIVELKRVSSSLVFQDAQQERSTFVSSLLPLLAEHSLQPPVADAQSIVSNVKVSYKSFSVVSCMEQCFHPHVLCVKLGSNDRYLTLISS